MKLNEAVSKFLADLTAAGRSPATIVAYNNDLQQLVTAVGDQDVTKITTKELEKFIGGLSEQGFKNKTISRKLNSIKSLFKTLQEAEQILVDPSKPIPHPDIKTKLPRILAEAEYMALRQASKSNSRLYALIELMLQTGMRIGEISRLKVEDIKFKSKPPQILISENASTSMRLIELNPMAAKCIKDFLPERMAVEGDQGYLFNTKNGSNMIIRNIRSSVNRIFKKVAIKDATVNDLRNTFIAKQLDAGVSLAKVAQTVGHRRFSSTEKFLPAIERKNPGKGEKIVQID